MKKRKMITMLLVFVFAIALPITAFAGTTDTAVGNSIRLFCGIDTSKLTDQQKTDMLDSYKQMMEAKKDAVKKMVANKTITAAEGDALLKSIDDMVKYRVDNGFNTGTGYGMMNGTKGFGMGNGGKGRGNGGMRATGGCVYTPATTTTVPNTVQ